MTERTTPKFHPEIDGVRQILEYPISKVGDGVSDTYLDLWNLATEPDKTFAERRLTPAERQDIAAARRGKILRRVGALASVQNNVIIPRFASWPDRKEATMAVFHYGDTIEQIIHMYGLQPEEIAQVVRNMRENEQARPHYLR